MENCKLQWFPAYMLNYHGIWGLLNIDLKLVLLKLNLLSTQMLDLSRQGSMRGFGSQASCRWQRNLLPPCIPGKEWIQKHQIIWYFKVRPNEGNKG